MDKNSRLVYSTDSKTVPAGAEEQKADEGRSRRGKDKAVQTARISLDRKGRKGKSVTVIEGLSVNPQHLADIAKKLKQHLGTGGTSKQGRIEIQGDHRKRIAEKLQELGFKTKFVGG